MLWVGKDGGLRGPWTNRSCESPDGRSGFVGKSGATLPRCDFCFVPGAKQNPPFVALSDRNFSPISLADFKNLSARGQRSEAKPVLPLSARGRYRRKGKGRMETAPPPQSKAMCSFLEGRPHMPTGGFCPLTLLDLNQRAAIIKAKGTFGKTRALCLFPQLTQRRFFRPHA